MEIAPEKVMVNERKEKGHNHSATVVTKSKMFTNTSIAAVMPVKQGIAGDGNASTAAPLLRTPDKIISFQREKTESSPIDSPNVAKNFDAETSPRDNDEKVVKIPPTTTGAQKKGAFPFRRASLGSTLREILKVDWSVYLATLINGISFQVLIAAATLLALFLNDVKTALCPKDMDPFFDVISFLVLILFVFEFCAFLIVYFYPMVSYIIIHPFLVFYNSRLAVH